MQYVDYVAPTETEDGHEAYYYCTGCGKYFYDADGNSEIADLSDVSIAATGNNDETPTHTHTLTHIEAVAATCTTAGNIEYWYCSTCEKYFSDADAANEITQAQTVTAVIAHSLTYTAAVEATCTTAGNIEYWYCSTCGKYFSDAQSTNEITQAQTVTAVIAHSLTHTEAVAATCTTAGNIEYWYCSDCGKYFSDADATNEITFADTVISATGKHIYEGTYKYDEDGHWRECTACGEKTETEAHTLDENNICTVCGYEYIAPGVGLAYTLSEDETYYTLSGIGECTDTEIVIPSKYNGLYVMAIAESAFIGNTTITSVYIPNSVTSIGDYAFFNCTSLESLTISDSVASIGNYAFEYCTSLESIIIPDSVTSIGKGAFWRCTSLESITIPDSVTSIGSSAFYGCTSLIYNEYENGYYLGNGNNEYIILVDVIYTTVSTFTINSSTKFIDEAFYNCTSLECITIPDSVTSIGERAFFGCTSLESIIIGDGVTSIGNYAFYNCTSFESITISDSVISIGESAFGGCTSLESITIPDSVTTIGESAFENCTSLISVIIPDSVTSIGSQAFYNCTSLESIAISNSVTSIGNYAFENCTSLKSIIIPNSVTSIGSYAFYKCASLESITIGNSVTSIGSSVFRGCTSLTNITVASGNSAYKSIDGNLYSYDGTELIQYAIGKTDTSFSIPDSVIFIGERAFHGCTSLESITIPDSVIFIGERAFYGCTSLESIIIPNSVIFIDGYIFLGCTSLTNITVASGNSTYKSIDGNLYSYDGTELIQYAIGKTDTSFTIPDDVTSIDSYAFWGCSSLESINIPDSVTSISNYAFGNCSSLQA